MKRPTAALLLPALVFVFPVGARADELTRTEMPGEIVVCFETEDANVDLPATIEAWDLARADDAFVVGGSRVLLQWRRRGETKFTNVVLIRYPEAVDGAAVVGHLATVGDIEWTAPNYRYIGDPREFIPNDPQYGAQYHHPLMQNDLAWDITLGDAGIVTAVTDDGVDLDHEDLAANVWVNAGEIPGNAIDDDANGYIDDVNGWDFVHNNNNPNPNSGGDDHGTHVAGIAGARTNNAVGVAGVAGHATIMPVQFYDPALPWTAAIIAEAFAYAVDNGAHIITTSYNINGWVGDPVVTAAFDYLYDNGVLHTNSAGNGNELNPVRQAFHQTLLVASTDAGDVRSSFSNYGTGIDIAAPGSSVFSTILNNAYGTKSGTSMAAPNAAGVAALIWSANPTWTRDQVAAQLVATADNIDVQNPIFVGLLGGGRVNPFNALTMTLPGPQVTLAENLPSEGSILIGDLTSFKLRFDQILDPATVNDPSAFSLVYAGPDGMFGTGDDVPILISWDEYLIASNEIVFSVDEIIEDQGAYRVTADASVLINPFGTAIDGDGNGTPGDSWERTFTLCETTTTVVFEDTLESGVGWSVENIAILDGAWDPDPSVPAGGGTRGDPPTDFDGSGRCFLTDNVAGDSDVDGGPTRLTSMVIDASGVVDPYLSYARWFTSDDDFLEVEVSNDNGGSWTNVENVPGTSGWVVHVFRVSDFVTPSSQMRLRFSASDSPNNSVTEAAIDWIRVLTFECDPDPADINGDGVVNVLDLLLLLAAWGPCGSPPCPEDVNGDGVIDVLDLLEVLAAWT